LPCIRTEEGAMKVEGKTNEDVIAGFTGSAEYYKKHTS
jgi:hypothetical protein